MPECESCGASVDAGERECPYCGHSFVTKAAISRPTTVTKPRTDDAGIYSLERETGTVHFGDGETGARPTTGQDNLSVGYRHGVGSDGFIVCSNCKHENPEYRTECEACGTALRKPGIGKLRR